MGVSYVPICACMYVFPTLPLPLRLPAVLPKYLSKFSVLGLSLCVYFAFKLFMKSVNMQHGSTLLYMYVSIVFRSLSKIEANQFNAFLLNITYISRSWSPNWRNTSAKFSPGPGDNFRARLIVVNVAWFAYEMNYAAGADLPTPPTPHKVPSWAWHGVLNYY